MIHKVEIGKRSKPDFKNHTGICLHKVEKKNTENSNPDWSRDYKPLDIEGDL